MTSLIDIRSQIEELEKQAAAIRAKDFDATVQDILTKMQAFGITVDHLQNPKPLRGNKPGRKPGRKAAGAVAAPVKKASKRAGVAVAAKYRGPNGETWTGRGLTPKWLSSLVAGGRSKEEFLISA